MCAAAGSQSGCYGFLGRGWRKLIPRRSLSTSHCSEGSQNANLLLAEVQDRQSNESNAVPHAWASQRAFLADAIWARDSAAALLLRTAAAIKICLPK